jgi:hypothetical protein
MSLWLTEDELYELTGYKQRQPQRRALAELGVKWRTRPADGFPLVDRSQFSEGSRSKRREPNWNAANRT